MERGLCAEPETVKVFVPAALSEVENVALPMVPFSVVPVESRRRISTFVTLRLEFPAVTASVTVYVPLPQDVIPGSPLAVIHPQVCEVALAILGLSVVRTPSGLCFSCTLPLLAVKSEVDTGADESGA